MFNLTGSEIIFILLIALVVLGPEKLPGAIRKATQTYAEFRKMSNSFQNEFKSAIDEPLREMRETADLVKETADPKKMAEQLEAEAEAEAKAQKKAEQAAAVSAQMAAAGRENKPDLTVVEDTPDESFDAFADPVVAGSGAHEDTSDDADTDLLPEPVAEAPDDDDRDDGADDQREATA